MATKTVNARIQLKHDTYAKWSALDTTFTPKNGEVIIYTDGTGNESAPKIKIGDGTTLLGSLPFLTQDTSDKMDKTNPTGTGSFSLNRKANTTVGDYSFAEGNGNEARGEGSHAEGNETLASGNYSHAEGCQTTAGGHQSHVEGYKTATSAYYAHAEGESTTASASDSHVEGYKAYTYGKASHAEGGESKAGGYASHAEGNATTASGEASHSEGLSTKASGVNQHVQGAYNVEDTSSTYADIVGGGSSDTDRKNISALGWDGDLHLKGNVYVGCNDDSTGGTKIGAGLPYTTTAPTEANTDGLKIVVLDSEPSTKYDGWLYLIKE